MKIGEVYPPNTWFYIISSQSWCNSSDCTSNPDSGYRKEADELTEFEANSIGIYKN